MTDRYAVIGTPIAHSKSPLIHMAFAAQTRQDMDYAKLEAPPGGFAAAVDAFRAAGGRGLNVTAPFKVDAFELAGEASEPARLAGAANALAFDRPCVRAENFDGIGLVNDIQRNLGFALKGRRVLMLGAGGAARGVLLPFLQQRPDVLVIANRTLEKARSLAHQCGGASRAEACTYADLSRQRFDIVVNATSASLRGELPPVPAAVFGNAQLVYELAYGKGLTPFLRLARNAGVQRLADGVGMLVEQAAEAFAWWRGVRPDTAPLIRQLTVALVS